MVFGKRKNIKNTQFLIAFFGFLTLVSCGKNEIKPKFIETKSEVKINQNIRESYFAGSFYPSKSEELDNLIQTFLDNSKDYKEIKNPKVLIVPHAGYVYSGQVASQAYKLLENKEFENVIILSSAHAQYFDGVAISPDDFETPLGIANTNLELAKKISEENSERIYISSEAHLNDHTIEVQIPFLQKTIKDKDFKIVAILFGPSSQKKDEEILAKALAKNLSSKDIIVVSSDLSHYPDYETAKKCDSKTIEGILFGSEKIFREKISENEENFPNVDTFACGEKAISAALEYLNILEIKNSLLLDYKNSGDKNFGDKERVVGYVSIAFFNETEINKIAEDYKKEALEIVRGTIKNHFESKEKKPVFPNSEILKQERGVFVTLHKNGELRGCIGTFFPEGKSLAQNIQDMALESAFHDTRFLPLEKDELREIDIEISILSPLKKIDDPNLIKVGKHGVMVKKGLRGGVYLPQVATEQGWSREEFLDHLCEYKAGIGKDAWRDGSAELFSFTADVFGEKDF